MHALSAGTNSGAAYAAQELLGLPGLSILAKFRQCFSKGWERALLRADQILVPPAPELCMTSAHG